MLSGFRESTISDLYDNAVIAFPRTQKRQFSTQPIEISNIKLNPFIGMKTLLVTALATNEDREYSTLILFKGMKYSTEPSGNLLSVKIEGRNYNFKRPVRNENEVLIRCSCPDNYWRFRNELSVNKSLYGSNRKKYEAKYNPGSANPLKLPGLCKHLMAMEEELFRLKII